MQKVNFIYFAIAFIAVITSVYLYKKFNKKPFMAHKVLAAYLGKPEDTISCQILKAGLSGDTVNLCADQHIKYIVKSFQDTTFGKHEIYWTQRASNLGIGPRLYVADARVFCIIRKAVSSRFCLVPNLRNNVFLLKPAALAIS